MRTDRYDFITRFRGTLDIALPKKYRFYEVHGVEELYTFDQGSGLLTAFVRVNGQLEPQSTEGGFVSPLLGIRIEVVGDELKGWYPDCRPFLSMSEMDAARKKAEQERQKAEQERDEALAQAKALEERPRALGIDPGSL